jgi:hypothetical protein
MFLNVMTPLIYGDQLLGQHAADVRGTRSTAPRRIQT